MPVQHTPNDKVALLKQELGVPTFILTKLITCHQYLFDCLRTVPWPLLSRRLLRVFVTLDLDEVDSHIYRTRLFKLFAEYAIKPSQLR